MACEMAHKNIYYKKCPSDFFSMMYIIKCKYFRRRASYHRNVMYTRVRKKKKEKRKEKEENLIATTIVMSRN